MPKRTFSPPRALADVAVLLNECEDETVPLGALPGPGGRHPSPSLSGASSAPLPGTSALIRQSSSRIPSKQVMIGKPGAEPLPRKAAAEGENSFARSHVWRCRTRLSQIDAPAPGAVFRLNASLGSTRKATNHLYSSLQTGLGGQMWLILRLRRRSGRHRRQRVLFRPSKHHQPGGN